MPPTRGLPYPPLNPATRDGMADRPTVSITQAQAQCQVARRTIYNWLTQGKLEYVRNAGGHVRIFADTLFREGRG
jgi:excisionase family DNA binding protein